MTNDFQTIVDRDASSDQAESLARRALEWLADTEIIEERASRCLPWPDRTGFRPGPSWASAIVEFDESFLDLDVNGVQVLTGRQIFDAGQFEPTPHCPRCHAAQPAEEQWSQALEAWKEGNDGARLDCGACDQSALIADWRHIPPIGLGCLGIKFWNWPSLNREFVEQVGRAVGGRVLLVEGRQSS